MKKGSLTSIADINPAAKTIMELENKCFNLSNTINTLLTRISDKELEIVHLKKLLEGLVPKNQAIKLEVTDEELIADMQLRKLKEYSTQRELSLEEVKKFDLLVKNKRLAKGDATATIDHKPLPQNVAPQELLKIAGAKIKTHE